MFIPIGRISILNKYRQVEPQLIGEKSGKLCVVQFVFLQEDVFSVGEIRIDLSESFASLMSLISTVIVMASNKQ